MLIILACLAGVLLGLTCNVLVLLPVILAGARPMHASHKDKGSERYSRRYRHVGGRFTGRLLIGLTGRDMVAQLRARLNIAQSRRV